MRKIFSVILILEILVFPLFSPSIFAKSIVTNSHANRALVVNPVVKVEGRKLMVDFDHNGVYEPYFVKGVGYSPMPIGRHPSDWGWPLYDPRPANVFADANILNRDFTYLSSMHVNTIRIWKGNDTQVGTRFPIKIVQQTLNLAEQHGIKVVAGFWIDGTTHECHNGQRYYNTPDFTNQSVRNDYKNRFVAYVNTFKNHPAILFWVIGNENNLFLNPNDTNRIRAYYSLINEMAQAAHQVEGTSYHPVAVVNGDLDFIGNAQYGTDDVSMPALDIWGANVYRGNSFGNLFVEYVNKSTKPFWISEFGVDAWFSQNLQNPDVGYEDQATQAQWDGNLWDEIVRNHTATIGATIMEYSDEWWKPYEWIDGGSHNSQQNHFGTGPVDTDCPPDGIPDWYPPSPDNYFNAEWWGIMSIAPNPMPYGYDIMTPRQVYTAMAHRFQCSHATGGIFYAGPENRRSCDLSHACCPKAALKSKNGRCVKFCGYPSPVKDEMRDMIKTILKNLKPQLKPLR